MEMPIEYRLKVIGTGSSDDDKKSTKITEAHFDELDPDPKDYPFGNVPFVRTLSAIETRDGSPCDVLYLVFNLNDDGVRMHLLRHGYTVEIAAAPLCLPKPPTDDEPPTPHTEVYA